MARLARRVQVENDYGEIMHYVRHTGGGLVSPHARVPESVPVGTGTYVEKGAVVGPGCRLGNGSWVDHDVVLGRDVRIGDNVRLAPETRVGDRARVGSGARVGRRVLVEPGAVVPAAEIVPDDATVRRRGGLRTGDDVAASPPPARPPAARRRTRAAPFPVPPGCVALAPVTFPPSGPGPPPRRQQPPPPHPGAAAVPLAPRAVLEGRPPGRARVGVIVTIAVASLCLLVGLVLAALSGVGTFTVGLLLALVPLGIWVPVVLALDRL